MDVKTQQKAAGLIKDIENRLDDPNINLPYPVLNWLDELKQIISKENVITNLHLPPLQSVNIYVCKDNVEDRIKEFGAFLSSALHDSDGIRVKFEYCNESYSTEQKSNNKTEMPCCSCDDKDYCREVGCPNHPCKKYDEWKETQSENQY